MTVIAVQHVQHEVVPLPKQTYQTKKTPEAVPVVQLTNVSTKKAFNDKLHLKAKKAICGELQCLNNHQNPAGEKQDVYQNLSEAKAFLEEYFTSIEGKNNNKHLRREQSVSWGVSAETFEFDLTRDELIFGGRLAWRNTPTSISRFNWKNLNVLDCRHVQTAADMFASLCQHIYSSINGGSIRPVMTIFPQRREGQSDFRVWNRQLIGYAGYQQEDGTILGDPDNVYFTQLCEQLGWKGASANTPFDVLPLVINSSGNDPEWFDLPEYVRSLITVPLQHPRLEWFEKLGLQWRPFYSESDHLIRIAGNDFPAVCLSHSCISSDVATNLMDHSLGFDLLQTIGTNMSLDTSVPSTLWKEEAVLELNEAILFSYQKAGVEIVDHHSASNSFVEFFNSEQKTRGGCPADWNKIVPVLSSGITLAFHQEMVLYQLSPCIDKQAQAWKVHDWVDPTKTQNFVKKCGMSFKSVAVTMKWLVQHLEKRVRATILFASETGRSESFAENLATLFGQIFRVNLKCMRDYNLKDVAKEERLLLFVTSTFGNGGSPENGKKFYAQMKKCASGAEINNNSTSILSIDAEAVIGLRFAVLGLGSSAYPDFCKFGHFCNDTMISLGAQQILPIETADELRGQDKTFNSWATKVFKASCSAFDIAAEDQIMPELSSSIWESKNYRLVNSTENSTETNIVAALSKIHNRTVATCTLISRQDLVDESSQKTILVTLKTVKSEHNPGDHLAVFPSNRSSLVSAIINRLGLNSRKHQAFQPQRNNGNAWVSVSRFPPCSWNTALTHFLDLTNIPQQQFLQSLSNFATNEVEKEQILRLSMDDDVYDEWRNGCPTMLNILNEFPSLKPDPMFLLLNLPLLQPRFYSISNSASLAPGEIHLTVGVLAFKNNAGKDRFGVCSNYLKDLAVGGTVHCFVRKAPEFYLPSDKHTPVVMIGAGTGLAPFRSFWQQREYEMSKSNADNYGQMKLYFGCRHPDVDHLFADEMQDLSKNSVITSVPTAFSRLNPFKKVYVQNVIEQDGELMWVHLSEGGHVYICGDATMAGDVTLTLRRIIQKQGRMSSEKAQRFIESMRESELWHEDIFTSLRPRRS